VADEMENVMSEQEYSELMDVATVVYKLFKNRRDAKADKLVIGKMVGLEILTETGHLTTTFRDCLQMIAEDSQKTIKEIVDDEGVIFGTIIEYTRDEDYEDPEKYFSKKTKYEQEEYYEMVRIVRRCVLLETAKMKPA
jgi:hypothetical protein